MALTKITSRILDSSGVTILGTISTGVWQGTAINQTYLVGQSGTNTGDETLARINALDITELGTVSSGVWNGTVIASAYLDADTAHLSTTQTFTGAKTFSSNVGIGTTSSNWKSTWKALNIGQSVGLFSQDNNTTGLSSNVIFDGSNWTNKNIGATAFYQQSEGAHYFYGNGSSTDAAGTTFSPTTRLTISSGGEAFLSSTLGLTIGQSSASGTRTRLIYDGVYSYSTALYLNAVSSQPIYFKTSNTTRLTISSGGDLSTSDGTFTMHDGGGSPLAFKGKSSNGGSEIDWYANNGTTRIGYFEIAQTAASKLNIETANDFEIYTNSTKRLTISSGGNMTLASGLSLFTQGPGRVYTHNVTLREQDNTAKFQIYSSGGGCVFYNAESNGAYYFYTNGTERMRISSGGNVLINTTGSGTNKLQVGGAMTVWYDSNFVRSASVIYDGLYVAGQTGYLWNNGSHHWVIGTNGTERMRITSGGDFHVGTTSNHGFHTINKSVAAGGLVFGISSPSTGYWTALFGAVDQGSSNSAQTALFLRKRSSTGRSINAAGTINAGGNDYAEYMTKAVTDTIEKGDIVGINSSGLLTNVFSESISFVIKSTDPSYVGGDSWGNDLNETDLEIERAKVDRIAFSGQVPCNVTGASVGDYIIPVSSSDGKITGEAVSNPTFEQYKISVGKVWKIMSNGNSWVAVKIG